jgi:hypothetical protein
MLIGLLAAGTLVMMFFAAVTYFVQHPELIRELLPMVELPTNQPNLSDGSVYFTWIIGILMLIVLSAVSQGLQVKLATESAASRRAQVGQLFRTALKRSPALIAIGLLGLLIMIAAGLVFGILAPVLGLGTFILALLFGVYAIYACIRLVYVMFAIVSEGKGPIEAVKYSWQLSNGHVVETLGICAVTIMLIWVPTSLLDAASRGVDGSLASILNFIGMLVALIVGVVSIMGLALRFTQLQAIQSGGLKALPTHISNYIAIVVLIVVLPLLAAMTPPMPNDKMFYPEDLRQRIDSPSPDDSMGPDYRFY